MSEWSNWTDCSSTCGLSISVRNRSVMTEAEFGGETCLDLNDTRFCVVPGCPSPGLIPLLSIRYLTFFYCELFLESLCYGKEDGNYVDPNRPCSVQFLSCTNELEEWISCPENLVFDPITGRCEQFKDIRGCLLSKYSLKLRMSTHPIAPHSCKQNTHGSRHEQTGHEARVFCSKEPATSRVYRTINCLPIRFGLTKSVYR